MPKTTSRPTRLNSAAMKPPRRAATLDAYRGVWNMNYAPPPATPAPTPKAN